MNAVSQELAINTARGMSQVPEKAPATTAEREEQTGTFDAILAAILTRANASGQLPVLCLQIPATPAGAEPANPEEGGAAVPQTIHAGQVPTQAVAGGYIQAGTLLERWSEPPPAESFGVRPPFGGGIPGQTQLTGHLWSRTGQPNAMGERLAASVSPDIQPPASEAFDTDHIPPQELDPHVPSPAPLSADRPRLVEQPVGGWVVGRGLGDALPAERVLDHVGWMVAERFRARGAAPDAYGLRLKLYPEQLGQVDIEIRVTGREVEARFQLLSPEALPLLSSRSEELRLTLQQAGLTLSGFTVGTGAGQSEQRNPHGQSVFGPRRRPAPGGTPAEQGATRVMHANGYPGRIDTLA